MLDRSTALPNRLPRFGSTAIVVIIITSTLLGVSFVSRVALLGVVVNLITACVLMLPPSLAGIAIIHRLTAAMLPLRWRLLLGIALGLGATSLLVLILGWMGLLGSWLWKGYLVICATGGVVGSRSLWKEISQAPAAELPSAGSSASYRLLWLLASPFLVLALLASSNPPGFIWQEEGFGYDVLEYHLQLPKEYRSEGVIAYRPHNVYANFPANVEMLYLFAMIVLEDDLDIGVVANMMHLIFALLAVATAWAIGRDVSARAGTLTGVLTAGTGWLTYLSGLAYVENGMLFFGFVATGLLLRAIQQGGRDDTSAFSNGIKLAAWSGVCAGLACGCKYTAIPMIAMPIALLFVAAPLQAIRHRIACLAVCALCAVAVAGPWLVKNFAMTGNPVFPLVNSWFQSTPPGWGEAQTSRWDRGHRVPIEYDSPGGRFEALWDRIPGDPLQRFGPALLLIALLGLLVRRLDRSDLALLALLLVQVAVWLWATHLFARFTVVFLLALIPLCSRVFTCDQRPRLVTIVTVITVGGLAWNFVFLAKLHHRESVDGASASWIYEGELTGFEYFKTIQEDLPPNAKLLLIGDTKAFYFRRDVDYCVAFNRNPFFVAAAETREPQELMNWLRQHEYTHVIVNWSEVRRISNSYGFSPAMSQANLLSLFEGLVEVGLLEMQTLTLGANTSPYVTIYQIQS